MKGRNTVCVTIRLDDSIVKSLQEKAIKQGFKTVGQYIKAQILKSYSESTIKGIELEGNKIIGLTDKGEKVKKPTSAEIKEWKRFKKG